MSNEAGQGSTLDFRSSAKADSSQFNEKRLLPNTKQPVTYTTKNDRFWLQTDHCLVQMCYRFEARVNKLLRSIGV